MAFALKDSTGAEIAVYSNSSDAWKHYWDLFHAGKQGYQVVEVSDQPFKSVWDNVTNNEMFQLLRAQTPQSKLMRKPTSAQRFIVKGQGQYPKAFASFEQAEAYVNQGWNRWIEPQSREAALAAFKDRDKKLLAQRRLKQPQNFTPLPVVFNPKADGYWNNAGFNSLGEAVRLYGNYLRRLSKTPSGPKNERVEFGGRIDEINGKYYATLPVQGTPLRVNVPRETRFGQATAILHSHTDKATPPEVLSPLDLYANYVYGIQEYMIPPEGDFFEYFPTDEVYDGDMVDEVLFDENGNAEPVVSPAFYNWTFDRVQQIPFEDME